MADLTHSVIVQVPNEGVEDTTALLAWLEGAIKQWVEAKGRVFVVPIPTEVEAIHNALLQRVSALYLASQQKQSEPEPSPEAAGG